MRNVGRNDDNFTRSEGQRDSVDPIKVGAVHADNNLRVGMAMRVAGLPLPIPAWKTLQSFFTDSNHRRELDH